MFAKFVFCCVDRNERVASVCKLSSNVSKEMSSYDIGLYNALKYAATLDLGNWNLCTQSDLKDLAPCLKDLEFDIKCNFTKMALYLFLIKG